MKKFSFGKTLFLQLKLIPKKYYPVFFFNAVFGGILPVLSVFFTKLIIDVFQQNASQNKLIQIVLILCGSCVLCYVLNRFLTALLEASFFKMRHREFTKSIEFYNEIDYEYIEDSAFQDKIWVAFQALDGDNKGFQHTYNCISQLSTYLVSIVLFAVLISFFNVWIAVLCFFSTIMTACANRFLAKYMEKMQEKRAHLYRQKEYFNLTCSDFNYGKDIRIFDLKDSLLKKYRQKSWNYIEVVKAIGRKEFAYGLIGLLALLLQDGFSYFLIIKGYFDGILSLSEASLYLSALVGFSTVLRSFTDWISLLMQDIKLTQPYFELLQNKMLYQRAHLSKTDERVEGAVEIEFCHVDFKYPNTERYILKDFNFKIEKGQKIAIVGENGAGKTTIVKLLCGLFHPTAGQILINGKDISSYPKQTYYQMFSTVFQDFTIYAASILENVIGPDQDEDAIKRGKECLDRVGLKKKIAGLPKQYDTPLLKVIDETGVDLSGGERQKVAIARALYKDGNAVILDEPTSALDAVSEAEIYQSFNDLVTDKTAIYISHRLSSTKFCDRIAYFTAAGLEEYGTHEELMAQKKGYFHMFMVQGKYYQEETAYEENK